MEREPQVGDRVDAILGANADTGHPTHAKGQKHSGTVRETPTDNDSRFLIEFDPPFYGHNGRSRDLLSGRGFYISRAEITKFYAASVVICEDGYREYQAILAAQEMMGE